jgi:hypothetical protein
LTKRGADVLAVDNQSMLPLPQEQVDDSGQSAPVVSIGDEASLKQHPERTLLLVAPPPTDMARRCLELYEGSTLVYVGEGRGGAHADDAFFDALEHSWKVGKIVEVDPFPECFERMYILQKKERKGWMAWIWRM